MPMRVFILSLAFTFARSQTHIDCSLADSSCTTTNAENTNALCNNPIDRSIDCDSITFECHGSLACFSKSIACPSSARCTVECSGISACQGVAIDATNAASLHVISTGQAALSYARVYCPVETIDDDAVYSCSVTHINDDVDSSSSSAHDGLNNLNLFTAHAASEVTIDCNNGDDHSLCWNGVDDAPYSPVVHYGDNYGQQCSLTDSMECVSATQTTVAVVDNNGLWLHQQFEVRAAVILFAMGSVFGALLTLFMCLMCPRSRCSNRCRDLLRQPSSASESHASITPTRQSQRDIRKASFLQKFQRHIYSYASRSKSSNPASNSPNINVLSPSLQKLSPQLNPQKHMVDFASGVDFDDEHDAEAPPQFELTLPAAFRDAPAAVHVTVAQYANADNQCDEDEEPNDVKTPSSTLIQFKPRRFPSYVPHIRQGEPTGTLSVITPVEMGTTALPAGHNPDKSIDVDLIVLDEDSQKRRRDSERLFRVNLQ